MRRVSVRAASRSTSVGRSRGGLLSRLFLAFALVTGALTLAAPAAAQQDPKAAEAKKQFEAGMVAMNAGDLKRARELFSESIRLVAKANTVFNLADCEEKLGLFATAADHFQAALNLLPPGDDRQPTFTARIAALTPKVPVLTLTLAEEIPEGTTVTLDGNPAALAKPLRLDSGPHTVTVKAPGRPDKTYPIDLSEGQRQSLTLQPGDQASGPGIGALRTTGIIALSLGGASLIGGGVTGALALQQKQSLESLCPDITHCVVQGDSRAQTGTMLATASTALFATGLGLAATGTVLILLGRPRTVTAQASVQPTFAGLSIKGSF